MLLLLLLAWTEAFVPTASPRPSVITSAAILCEHLLDVKQSLAAIKSQRHLHDVKLSLEAIKSQREMMMSLEATKDAETTVMLSLEAMKQAEFDEAREVTKAEFAPRIADLEAEIARLSPPSPPVHPSYAARIANMDGVMARWGPEEISRVHSSPVLVTASREF